MVSQQYNSSDNDWRSQLFTNSEYGEESGPAVCRSVAWHVATDGVVFLLVCSPDFEQLGPSLRLSSDSDSEESIKYQLSIKIGYLDVLLPLPWGPMQALQFWFDPGVFHDYAMSSSQLHQHWELWDEVWFTWIIWVSRLSHHGDTEGVAIVHPYQDMRTIIQQELRHLKIQC